MVSRSSLKHSAFRLSGMLTVKVSVFSFICRLPPCFFTIVRMIHRSNKWERQDLGMSCIVPAPFSVFPGCVFPIGLGGKNIRQNHRCPIWKEFPESDVDFSGFWDRYRLVPKTSSPAAEDEDWREKSILDKNGTGSIGTQLVGDCR